MVILSVLFFLISTSVSSHLKLSQRRKKLTARLLVGVHIQHVMLAVYRLYQGVVVFPETTGLSPRVFFNNDNTKLFVAKNGVYLAITLLGDAVVVHGVPPHVCILWF
jgi:hypothetical protein